ncbi:MAG: hypothetical protein ACK442_10215 [Novosphingobium sp.]|nr:hypothetical protein [Brevundimonas sp.]MCZ8322071.1 hypothetical protein [Novosphingobium sp.]
MPGEAHNSDVILREAKRSLVNNRDFGGRRNSIGRRSAALKREHALKKAKGFGLTVAAIFGAVVAAGIVLDGIGITGVILAMAAMVAALLFFTFVPKIKVPTRDTLRGSDVKSLVGRTELWLEQQRPALPAPAVQLVDTIGLQLDALGTQLDGLDERAPAAVEVRKLVGEHLPDLVSTYTSIPRHLRGQDQGGRSPDQHLTDSLGKISTEIESVTRQLASGAIDNLAIKTRYLDYKYGAGPEGEPGQ